LKKPDGKEGGGKAQQSEAGSILGRGRLEGKGGKRKLKNCCGKITQGEGEIAFW